MVQHVRAVSGDALGISVGSGTELYCAQSDLSDPRVQNLPAAANEIGVQRLQRQPESGSAKPDPQAVDRHWRQVRAPQPRRQQQNTGGTHQIDREGAGIADRTIARRGKSQLCPASASNSALWRVRTSR